MPKFPDTNPGTVVAWNGTDTDWEMNRISEESLEATEFCEKVSDRSFYLMPENRSVEDAAFLCTSLGNLIKKLWWNQPELLILTGANMFTPSTKSENKIVRSLSRRFRGNCTSRKTGKTTWLAIERGVNNSWVVSVTWICMVGIYSIPLFNRTSTPRKCCHIRTGNLVREKDEPTVPTCWCPEQRTGLTMENGELLYALMKVKGNIFNLANTNSCARTKLQFQICMYCLWVFFVQARILFERIVQEKQTGQNLYIRKGQEQETLFQGKKNFTYQMGNCMLFWWHLQHLTDQTFFIFA